MWNDAQKIGAYLNSEAGSTKRVQAPLFSPFFSGKTEKKGPPEARPLAFPYEGKVARRKP